MKLKIRFSIATKLGLGFGILTLATILSSSLTYKTLNNNKANIQQITDVYSPSVSYLVDLSSMIDESKMLIKNWVFIEEKDDTPDKKKLINLHGQDFGALKRSINGVKSSWDSTDIALCNEVFLLISDSLFVQHRLIMDQLNRFEKYNDPMVVFAVKELVENNGEVIQLTDDVLAKLETLIKDLRRKTKDKNSEMLSSFDSFQKFIFWAGTILVIAAIIIALITYFVIARPVNSLKNFLLSMSRGILPREKMRVNADEIGDMANALNNYVETLKNTSEFANEIGKGHFDAEYRPLSEEDMLGNSLMEMRNNLVDADAKDKQRKKEDQIRNWSTQGVAKFAELLRKEEDNMEDYTYNIISELISYVGAITGGIFLINEDHREKGKIIELLSCFAYDRRKYLSREIEIGEGLVGRCFEEGETIYMTDVPEDYIKITSGLGEENPTSLLIVPLKINDDVYGVIEMASFKPFESYEIDFVEKIGENTASTVSSIKINQRTKLLLEESRLQSEELAAQEEEMRQNMEELQATQEEAARKTSEMESLFNSINEAGYVMELTVDGRISMVNQEYCKLYERTRDEIVGHYEGDNLNLLANPDYSKEEFWTGLKNGKRKKLVRQFEHGGAQKTHFETYTPVLDEYKEVSKVLKIAIEKEDFQN